MVIRFPKWVFYLALLASSMLFSGGLATIVIDIAGASNPVFKAGVRLYYSIVHFIELPILWMLYWKIYKLITK